MPLLLVRRRKRTHAVHGTGRNSRIAVEFLEERRLLSSPALGTIGFNVTDYGAVGDGIHDDAPAIQAAIDAAHTNGGVVYLPDSPPNGTGIYLVDSTLILRSGVILRGQSATGANDGSEGTTIKYAGSTVAPVIEIAAEGYDRGIQNLTIISGRTNKGT